MNRYSDTGKVRKSQKTSNIQTTLPRPLPIRSQMQMAHPNSRAKNLRSHPLATVAFGFFAKSAVKPRQSWPKWPRPGLQLQSRSYSCLASFVLSMGWREPWIACLTWKFEKKIVPNSKSESSLLGGSIANNEAWIATDFVTNGWLYNQSSSNTDEESILVCQLGACARFRRTCTSTACKWHQQRSVCLSWTHAPDCAAHVLPHVVWSK